MLLAGSLGVDGVHLVDSIASLSEFSLSLSLASLSRVKESSGLLHLSLEGSSSAVSQAGLLRHLLSEAGLLLIGALSLPQLTLVALDRLLRLIVGLVGVIKSNLQLIDVSLQLLLDSKSFSLGSLLRFQRGLHGVHGTSMILPGVLKLLFLLLDPAVNLLSDLAKLKLGSQHLIFLLLKGSLGLLKSSLELFLLNLESSALFVQLVDGAATVSKLVKEILDFISKVLVLASDNIQLLIGLIVGCLQAEDFRVEVSALGPAGLKFSHEVISLGLPFTNNLLKVLASLLSDDSSGVGALVLHLHPLKLVNSAESLGFKLGSPQLDLSLGLGQSLEDVVLLLSLLLNAHSEVFNLGAEVLVLGKEGSSVTSLGISQPLGVLQLGGQRNLVLS